jgi:hypothetical protein
MRSIGRIILQEWPIHDRGDLTEVDPPTTKEVLPTVRTEIARPELSAISVSQESLFEEQNIDRDTRLNIARDTRNFIWLMYGLAPSLSAIIHTHIVGLVYARESEGYSNVSIVAELAKWSELIGSLSIFMRYVKLRCLHLFALLFLQSFVDGKQRESVDKGGKKGNLCRDAGERGSDDVSRWNEDRRVADERRTNELKSILVQFLNKCGLMPETADSKIDNNQNKAEQKVQQIGDTFGLNSGVKPAEGLGIMPDVAPSTLLGDK